jgi:phosphoribosylformylglycinamidine synthase
MVKEKRKGKHVRTLIITGFGLNCENETAAAFKLVGAESEKIHLSDMLSGNKKIGSFHILAFIGGFSFGDHLGAGTVLANKLKHKLKKEIESFIADGKLLIGICNGFQTISRMGLVPALDGNYFVQEVALAHNDSGLFRDDWVYLKANPASPCIFTSGIDIIRLPVRHGEGKFTADKNVLKKIKDKNLIALQYCDEKGNTECGFPANPNGSQMNIAGICDERGRIFGLMPHPEAFLSPFNAPDWTEKKINNELLDEGHGLKIFRNAVRYAEKELTV